MRCLYSVINRDLCMMRQIAGAFQLASSPSSRQRNGAARRSASAKAKRLRRALA
jgi:hypothetical protein